MSLETQTWNYYFMSYDEIIKIDIVKNWCVIYLNDFRNAIKFF